MVVLSCAIVEQAGAGGFVGTLEALGENEKALPGQKMPAAETNRPSILIIDDDEQVRGLLCAILDEDYSCARASCAEEAMNVLKALRFDLVLSDINMGGISGLDLVPFVLKETPETVVVMISGQQTIDAAVKAMRAGAFDYITKPFEILLVQAAVKRALAHHELLEEKRRYEDQLEDLVRERAAEIERLAYFDKLTDLPNRLLFEDRLTQELKHAQRENQTVGVLLLRIDRFKKLSDTLGHDAGDRLLCVVADRIKRASGERGALARFEGDQFALMLTDINGPEQMLEMACTLAESLEQAFVLQEHQLYTTASMGICLSEAECQTPQEILKNAGVALDRAQSLGGNSHQFYLAEMHSRAVKRLTMESEFRRAVETGTLVIHYQPQVDLLTNRIVGAEALVRWPHPKLGLLPPAEFIPMAEETGLVLPMGEWVLRTACKQLAEWQERGLGDLRIGVNVAPQQFQKEDFRETLAAILLQTGIAPASLELEITETSIMQKGVQVVELLSELKQMGVWIAIDDFGMGYSSLAYLKRLPIDMLKIDGAFIKEATTEPDDAAIVVAIITLAHNLRLQVMAEGVETEEQARFLHLLKCDQAQGYLFGKPVPSEVFFSTAISTCNQLETQNYLQVSSNEIRLRINK